MRLTVKQRAELQQLCDRLPTLRPNDVRSARIENDELVTHVNRNAIVKTVLALREDAECRFTQLIDLTVVDYPEREERFTVVYCLLSMERNQRLRLKLSVGEDEPLPSLVDVFPTANWLEREAWDMYGVLFAGHPDLRRILTDYGFEGHPLRKDFPLTGHVEMRYDEDRKQVIYEPVTLTQDFRNWDFLSPWEGMTTQWLAGDEKANDSQAKDRETS